MEKEIEIKGERFQIVLNDENEPAVFRLSDTGRLQRLTNGDRFAVSDVLRGLDQDHVLVIAKTH